MRTATCDAQPRCLVCSDPLPAQDESGYHGRCSRALFGERTPPRLDLDLDSIEELARREVDQRVTVTGVQRKLSLDFRDEGEDGASSLTFVGLEGRFVLKPPAGDDPTMPENEHLTMRLAEVVGIETARNGLVRLSSGELAYLARRFDRSEGRKLALEDMCQLTGKLTEDKYRSSMEKVGKAILRWSSNPVLDATRFLDVAVLSFLTGDADMHLKNFSLLTSIDGTVRLSPAYDLLATHLLLPEDPEEMALALNGKRAKLERADFVALGKHLRIADKAIEATFHRFSRARSEILEAIDTSFLPPEQRVAYRELLSARWNRLEPG